MAAKRGENGKKPGNSRDCKNWHGLCDAVRIGKGRCPQPKGKTKKWTVKPPTSSAAATPSSVSARPWARIRSEEHTSELQSLMRISYAVFCLKKKNNTHTTYTQ